MTINYAYDPLYHLTAANYSTGQVYTYTYDAVGNRLANGAPAGVIPYMYDDANRPSSAGGVAYSWDNNGNLLADNSFNYSYDATNRLTEVRPIHGVGFTAYGYTYNGLGNLVQSPVTVCIGTVCNYIPITNTLDLAGGLTQVLSDGTNTYLYGDSRIAQYTGASARYFLDDALGSVRQLADASGAVNLTRSYQPYGCVMNSVGAGTTSFGFTGEWTDGQTGLLDLRARQYSPSTGRFISKDIWFGSYINLAEPGVSYDSSGTGQVGTGDLYVDYSRPQSLNGWAYSENNPVNFTDPTGHFICGFGSYWDDASKTCKPSVIGTSLSGVLPPWFATVAMQSSGTPGLGEIIATALLGGVCVYAIGALIHTAIQTQFQSVTVLNALIAPRSPRDWNHLARKLGKNVDTLGNNLESCKEAAGVPPYGQAVIDDESGDIFYNGEWIGNALDGC